MLNPLAVSFCTTSSYVKWGLYRSITQIFKEASKNCFCRENVLNFFRQRHKGKIDTGPGVPESRTSLSPDNTTGENCSRSQ